MKLQRYNKKKLIYLGRVSFWFLVGALIAIFLISGFAFIIFQKNYKNLVYPGVRINGLEFGGKTKDQVKDYFSKRNNRIQNTSIVFNYQDIYATSSAKDLNIGYDQNLISDQVISVGRSSAPLSNFSLILQAYITGVNLPASYRYDQEKLSSIIDPIAKDLDKDAVDALFQFQNGKVTAFHPSANGTKVNKEKINEELNTVALGILEQQDQRTVSVPIPVDIVFPEITTDKANNLGIKELIGVGTSLFQHSIPERIFNVELAASRVNGALIPPGETFSFDKALGDVSAFTGYKQAYVITNGKTVLGDGGGVCQVSTTFFRALLNAGLEITERTAHAYRVGYYEEDSPPGIDATIYVPSVDLKFKNDTGHYILVQTVVDPETLRLTVYLYGTKDGREVQMTTPVVTNVAPAPTPLYQDDPTLPVGTVKQVDFAAAGANVFFTRTVKKDGKVIITDKFTSIYKPWQAVFLRGTK